MGIVYQTRDGPPVNGKRYKKGLSDMLVDTTTNTLYLNRGTHRRPTWEAVGSVREGLGYHIPYDPILDDIPAMCALIDNRLTLMIDLPEENEPCQ